MQSLLAEDCQRDRRNVTIEAFGNKLRFALRRARLQIETQ